MPSQSPDSQPTHLPHFQGSLAAITRGLSTIFHLVSPFSDFSQPVSQPSEKTLLLWTSLVKLISLSRAAAFSIRSRRIKSSI